MPGIDSNNKRFVLKQVKTIKELCKMDEVRLKDLVGDKNGRELYEFINRKIEYEQDNLF